MRSVSFHLAMRSERGERADLELARAQPTDRWTTVTSRSRPSGPTPTAPRPASRAASSAALVSVMVPPG